MSKESFFFLENQHAKTPVLILAEHAGREIPAKYNGLGVDPKLFDVERNIASDYGINNIARLVAKNLNAPAVLGKYSRLLIDLNRTPEDPSLIMPITHSKHPVPGNQTITDEERKHRIATYHAPFRNAAKEQVERLLDAGICPLLFSIHAFDPRLAPVSPEDKDKSMPDIGLLSMEEHRAVTIMRNSLLNVPDILVMDNYPYDLRKVQKGSIHTYGEDYNLPIMAVEISIGRIHTEKDEMFWAEKLSNGIAKGLRPIKKRKRKPSMNHSIK